VEFALLSDMGPRFPHESSPAARFTHLRVMPPKNIRDAPQNIPDILPLDLLKRGCSDLHSLLECLTCPIPNIPRRPFIARGRACRMRCARRFIPHAREFPAYSQDCGSEERVARGPLVVRRGEEGLQPCVDRQSVHKVRVWVRGLRVPHAPERGGEEGRDAVPRSSGDGEALAEGLGVQF
jgi:hypothetical protein